MALSTIALLRALTDLPGNLGPSEGLEMSKMHSADTGTIPEVRWQVNHPGGIWVELQRPTWASGQPFLVPSPLRAPLRVPPHEAVWHMWKTGRKE